MDQSLSSTVSILDLNIEIIENILEYLDDIDVVNFYKTYKHFIKTNL